MSLSGERVTPFSRESEGPSAFNLLVEAPALETGGRFTTSRGAVDVGDATTRNSTDIVSSKESFEFFNGDSFPIETVTILRGDFLRFLFLGFDRRGCCGVGSTWGRNAAADRADRWKIYRTRVLTALGGSRETDEQGHHQASKAEAECSKHRYSSFGWRGHSAARQGD